MYGWTGQRACTFCQKRKTRCVRGPESSDEVLGADGEEDAAEAAAASGAGAPVVSADARYIAAFVAAQLRGGLADAQRELAKGLRVFRQQVVAELRELRSEAYALGVALESRRDDAGLDGFIDDEAEEVPAGEESPGESAEEEEEDRGEEGAGGPPIAAVAEPVPEASTSASEPEEKE